MCVTVLLCVFRILWRVTSCMRWGRRWRFWRSRLRSWSTGTRSWSRKTHSWRTWPVPSSSHSSRRRFRPDLPPPGPPRPSRRTRVPGPPRNGPVSECYCDFSHGVFSRSEPDLAQTIKTDTSTATGLIRVRVMWPLDLTNHTPHAELNLFFCDVSVIRGRRWKIVLFLPHSFFTTFSECFFICFNCTFCLFVSLKASTL